MIKGEYAAYRRGWAAAVRSLRKMAAARYKEGSRYQSEVYIAMAERVRDAGRREHMKRMRERRERKA